MMKFSRQSRLLKPAQFKVVFQQPIRSSDEFFRIMARNNGIQQNRLGMAVSKKACARAVGRNRIKRVIRENFRSVMLGPTSDNSLDIVVLPTAQAASQSNKTLDESLSNHWQKLTKKAGNRNIGIQPDQLRTQR
ncbi:MAG TPA: ribonuclease P protein component [Xanthomonadales bacterium]